MIPGGNRKRGCECGPTNGASAPREEKRVMDVAFRYTADAVQKAFVEQGLSLPREGRVEVNPEEISEQARKALLDLGKVEFQRDGLVGTGSPGSYYSEQHVDLTRVVYGSLSMSGFGLENSRYVEVASAPEDAKDVDVLVAQCARAQEKLVTDLREKVESQAREALQNAREALEEAKTTRRTISVKNALRGFPGKYPDLVPQQLKDESDALASEKTALDEEIERQQRADAQAFLASEQEKKEALLADRLAWIEEHASEFLRDAVAAGYDCKRRYIEERAAAEHPDYAVDMEDAAAWRPRSCPSPEAFAEAKRVGGTVVWLTSPPYEFEDFEEQENWEEREAVAIEDFRDTGVDLVREV